MQILLKDPSLAEAVVKKIHRRYPPADEWNASRLVPYLQETLGEHGSVIIHVVYRYSVDKGEITSDIYTSAVSELPTDKEFLTDKKYEYED